MNLLFASTVTRTSRWDVFIPFSGLHLLAVGGCLLVIAVVVIVGWHMRSRRAESNIRWSIAIFAICYWVSDKAWWNWNGVHLLNGLPLQVCDLNGLVAPLALLTLNRWLRATLYFWTFVLTVQAFIQPDLAAGPALLGFWAFWAGHTVVTACAAWDLAALQFRPGWPDLRRAYIVSAIYIAVIMPVNLWLDSNYGYIGNPAPEGKIPPLVQAFGPWPGRAVIIVALAALGFVLALWPWLVLKGRQRSPKITLDHS